MGQSISSRTAKTRDRILKAATQVFAQEGITGATTREIARVAQVNEVTLFRHFHSKDYLLGAVVERVTALQAEALAHPEEWTYDLYTDILHFAQIYDQMLEDHEALIRMFVGEARRHPDSAQQMLSEAVAKSREQFINYLKHCMQKELVHPQIDLILAVEQLTGMLFSGMLHRTAQCRLNDYSRQEYVESCVRLFVRGISTANVVSPYSNS
ncbi:TetR/AcrR family transcriptional regulator [Spirulina sp. CS-785/01]|uniref:TetR/AcrR family transcriptional regulator n=1 Tax=Spirulina sp. CS-785/01 TaxID=3021716 RepID=UPI00232AD733|nr:TetR/AcrR family transcriptional regulator [Spirulina sp. CS-785/01]MDB9311599.1 TetR/AcrR family transcriptional regulator [Spirulina sp. CS-785/01]